jgi:hypothetical protein
MRIICEHVDERPERLCHTLAIPDRNPQQPEASVLIGIDEELLAWLYIAPGCETDRTVESVLHLALDLIGSGSWAVIQASEAGTRMLVDAGRLEVLEPFGSSDEPGVLTVGLAQVK